MKRTIDAVYEGGAFRPLWPLDGDVQEGQRVQLILETEPLSFDEMLDIAARVYEGFSEQEVRDLEDFIRSHRLSFNERTGG